MKWRSELETGVKEIDEQHKELVSRVNQVLEACRNRKGKEVLGETLDFLGAYVVEHFRSEEQLQERYGYPQRAEHRQIHQQLISNFQGLKVKYDDKGATLPVLFELNSTLVKWLTEHIAVTDKAMAKYIREQLG